MEYFSWVLQTVPMSKMTLFVIWREHDTSTVGINGLILERQTGDIMFQYNIYMNLEIKFFGYLQKCVPITACTDGTWRIEFLQRKSKCQLWSCGHLKTVRLNSMLEETTNNHDTVNQHMIQLFCTTFELPFLLQAKIICLKLSISFINAQEINIDPV